MSRPVLGRRLGERLSEKQIERAQHVYRLLQALEKLPHSLNNLIFWDGATLELQRPIAWTKHTPVTYGLLYPKMIPPAGVRMSMSPPVVGAFRILATSTPHQIAGVPRVVNRPDQLKRLLRDLELPEGMTFKSLYQETTGALDGLEWILCFDLHTNVSGLSSFARVYSAEALMEEFPKTWDAVLPVLLGRIDAT